MVGNVTGFASSVVPNIAHNLSNGNGLRSADFWADVIVDTGGYVVSGLVGASVTVALSAPTLGISAPVASWIGVGATAVTSGAWDLYVAPSATGIVKRGLVNLGFAP